MTIESDTPVRRLRHLGPTVRRSETSPRLDPPVGPARLQRARLADPRGVRAKAVPQSDSIQSA
jgi:hypothetical protein